jgi:hypothetical protein
MGGTADDDSTADWPFLRDVHFTFLGKVRSSKKLAERLLRDFFARGRVDAEGRERYCVRSIEAEFEGRPFYSGQAIYTERDHEFWYDDPELGISCDFEIDDSSVRWIGPMVHHRDDDDAWEIHQHYKARRRLILIRLRPQAVSEFLRDVPLPIAEPERAAADPPTKPSPPTASVESEPKPAPKSTPPEMTPEEKLAAREKLIIKSKGLKRQVFEVMQREPPRKDEWGYNNKVYELIYKRPPGNSRDTKTISNYIAEVRHLFEVP